MAKYITAAYGLVTRLTTTNNGFPTATVSGDQWIDVSGLSPAPAIGDHYDGTDFTLDHTTLSAAQGGRLALLRDSCAAYIKGGFYIGQTLPNDPAGAYWYPCEINDQINMHVACNAAMVQEVAFPDVLLGLWCAQGETKASLTNWAVRDHTVANVKSASAAMHQFISNAQYVLKDVTDTLFAAATVTEVNALVFDPF